jgi:penicillin-binding protein 2
MTTNLEPEGQQPPHSGLVLLQCLVLGLFAVFALRLWYLQIHRGEEFAQKARDNQLRREAIYAPRGLIRDRDGKLVAVNEPAYALGLVREDVKDLKATLAQVSAWTGIPAEDLVQRVAHLRKRIKPFEPLILVQDLPFDLLARIEANTLFWPGLEIVVRPKRYYPQGPLLAHVLGYVAEVSEEELERDPGLAMGDLVGKNGMELVLESRLRGTKGVANLEVDATGRRLGEEVVTPPGAGENLTLSIDLGLQEHCFHLLDGQAGSLLVMDPATGRILAYVSQPSFDNNQFVLGLSSKQWAELRDDPMHPMQNRPIQSAYPPGSVFKLAVGGAALHYGVSPKDTAFCNGAYNFGSRAFRCWKKEGHGSVDFMRGLVQSCDVYFYQMGDRLGVDRMSSFAKACGFSELTGIDLPHEKPGLIPSREWKRKRMGENWYPGENLNMAIGQGYDQVTPIQVARFVSALINGGELIKPSLTVNDSPVMQEHLPLTDKQREMILDAMVQTVLEGTARVLIRKDARIGGKTGTAQVVRLKASEAEKRRKLEEMEYWERDHAWIATFGQKNDRSYVVVCMVEHGGHGGSTAGPVVKAVYDYLFAEKTS